MLKQALILAGGKGTRLGNLTLMAPKPMMRVGGIPFLEYIVWNLKRYNITHILLSIGYLSQVIMDHFHGGEKFGVTIDYIIEKEALGTGGAIKLAQNKLESQFFVLNGDTLFDIDYSKLCQSMYDPDAVATIALRKVNNSSRYGSVLTENKKVISFSEKSQSENSIISGGVYVMKNQIFDYLPRGYSSLEKSIFPNIAGQGYLNGIIFNGFFIDIGVPETLELASELVPKWRTTNANN